MPCTNIFEPPLAVSWMIRQGISGSQRDHQSCRRDARGEKLRRNDGGSQSSEMVKELVFLRVKR